MTGRASAFAVLGLEPGADAAAIEQAYKRLIKEHHPDREGGDGTRAAEIIHAYRLLRGGKALVDPLQFVQHGELRRRSRWPVAAMLAVAGLAALTVAAGPSVSLPKGLWPAIADLSVSRPAGTAAAAAASRHEAMDDELHEDAIDGAVAEAMRLHRTKDEMALANTSRDCHHRFRASPSVALLDRCAAFDDAVIGLQDRDPLRDGGPFSALEVTGRQWSAASVLSPDYVAIDNRLSRIRLRVELALAPTDPATLAPAAQAARPTAAKPRVRRWCSPSRSACRAAAGPRRRHPTTATI
jgi:hypothetical protein